MSRSARSGGKRTAARAPSKRTAARPERWSKKVMETSDALDLEQGIFSSEDPHRIALSLRRSAERSTRRKAEPYRSAMSMLTFFINRAGKNLPARRRKVLMEAKDELRVLYGREPHAKPRRSKTTTRRGTSSRTGNKRAGAQRTKTTQRSTNARAGSTTDKAQ